MAPDRLWAPWRMEYIRTPKDSGECVFCEKGATGDDRENLVVYRGQHAYILMNLFPYNNAHLLIAPYRHLPDFEGLTGAERNEMLDLASRAMTVIRQALNAQGFNFGANLGTAAGAGIKEHIHMHVVPRWVGDTNFMPVLGETKVQVESLRVVRDQLAELLNK